MNIKKLNEAISRALRESKDDIFIPMLMDYFNVPASDIRKATEDENWKSNMTYDDYYVKGNGFFEVVSRDELLGSCVDRLEDLKDAAEASVIAKIFQQFIDDYGEDILINKKIEEVTEDNLEYVIDNIKFNKLSELLLSDDINYVTDIGQWVNSYDGEIHFLGNADGIDYYISRFDSGKNESVEPLKETSDSLIYKSNLQRHQNRANIEQALRELSNKRKKEIDRIEDAVLLTDKEKEEEIDKIDAEYVKERDILKAELNNAEKKLSNNYDLMIKCDKRLNKKDESLNSEKKNLKEEMEYNRKIWDIFEENIAEYLNEHGVKPEGNNVMKYISKNAAEIVKAVLNKNYDYEEDDQAIFELYYNCPIHFTDKAQAIDKLLEEYLAESLKRCLTIEDKLLQISSLDKNESVIDKKSIKEDVNTVYVLIDNKVALNFEQDFNFAIDLLDADGLIKRAEELDKNFEQNAKEANLGSPLMNDVLYAIKVLRNSHYFVLIKNVH